MSHHGILSQLRSLSRGFMHWAKVAVGRSAKPPSELGWSFGYVGKGPGAPI